MNYEALTFWWNVALTLLLFANVVWQWLGNQKRVTQEALTDLGDRVLVVEKTMPASGDIRGLYESLNSLNREMGELKEKLHANTKALDRVNEHLLNRD